MTDGERRAIKAISHPTRVRILEYLRDRPTASPVELAQELRVSLGQASYHVRRLEGLGFLRLIRTTAARGSLQHHYALRGGAAVKETVGALARTLLLPVDGSRVAHRAVLDALAIGQLRPEVEQLFGRMRELETETVRRGGVRGGQSAFSVDVVFLMEDASGMTGSSAAA